MQAHGFFELPPPQVLDHEGIVPEQAAGAVEATHHGVGGLVAVEDAGIARAVGAAGAGEGRGQAAVGAVAVVRVVHLGHQHVAAAGLGPQLVQQQAVAPAPGRHGAGHAALGAQAQAGLPPGLQVIEKVLEAQEIVEAQRRLGPFGIGGAQVGGKQALGVAGVAQRVGAHQEASGGVLGRGELGRDEAALALGLHELGAHQLAVIGELLEQQARLTAVGLAQHVLGAAAHGIGHEGELRGQRLVDGGQVLHLAGGHVEEQGRDVALVVEQHRGKQAAVEGLELHDFAAQPGFVLLGPHLGQAAVVGPHPQPAGHHMRRKQGVYRAALGAHAHEVELIGHLQLGFLPQVQGVVVLLKNVGGFAGKELVAAQQQHYGAVGGQGLHVHVAVRLVEQQLGAGRLARRVGRRRERGLSLRVRRQRPSQQAHGQQQNEVADIHSRVPRATAGRTSE